MKLLKPRSWILGFACVAATSGIAAAQGGWYYDWSCSSSQCASVMGGGNGTLGPFSSRSECQSAQQTYIMGSSCYQAGGSSGASSYGSPGAEIGAAIGNAIVDGFIAGFQQAEENARIEAEIRAREAAEAEAARQRALQDAALANYQQNQGLLSTLRSQPGAPGAAGAMQLRSADDMFGPAAVEQARANYCTARLKADAYASAMRSLDFASSSELYDTYRKMSVEQRSDTINLLLDNALGVSADRLEAVSKLTPETVGAAISKMRSFGFDDPVVFDKLNALAAARGQTEQVSKIWGETVEVFGSLRSGYAVGSADLGEQNGRLEALSAALGVMQNNPTLGIGITGFQLGLNAGFAYTLDHGLQSADARLEADLARQKELQDKIKTSVQQANLTKLSWRGAGGQGEPNCPGAGGAQAPAAAPSAAAPAVPAAPDPFEAMPSNAAATRSPFGSSIGSPAAEQQQRERYASHAGFADADTAVTRAREAQAAAETYADDLRAMMRNPAASVADRNAARLKLPDAQSAATNSASAVRVAEIKRDEAADAAEARLQAEALAAQQAAVAQGFEADDFASLRDSPNAASDAGGGKLTPFSTGSVGSGAADLSPEDKRGATAAKSQMGVLRHLTDGTDTLGQGFDGGSGGARVVAPISAATEPVAARVSSDYGLDPDVARKVAGDDTFKKIEADLPNKRSNVQIAEASRKKAWFEANNSPVGAEQDAKAKIAREADLAYDKAQRELNQSVKDQKAVVDQYIKLNKPVTVRKPKSSEPPPPRAPSPPPER